MAKGETHENDSDTLLMTAVIDGCGRNDATPTPQQAAEAKMQNREAPEEHASGEHRPGGETGINSAGASGDEGEEDGNIITVDATFDEVRAGAWLILSYDSET